MPAKLFYIFIIPEVGLSWSWCQLSWQQELIKFQHCFSMMKLSVKGKRKSSD